MKWFRNLFGRGREAPPEIDTRGKGDDFMVGDLALCIARPGEWYADEASDPHKGDLLKVSAVIHGRGNGGTTSTFLRFVGKPPHMGWDHLGFRKVQPDSEPCEEEFTAFIKGLPKRLLNAPTKAPAKA